jgi:hypothetical protein
MTKLLPKIIFFALIIGIAVAGTVLYIRTRASTDNGPWTMDNSKGTAPTANINEQQSVCIITVDGKKYDVQPLRSTHTGGDIFVCDTDMSDVFRKQHGDRLKMIEKYLVK